MANRETGRGAPYSLDGLDGDFGGGPVVAEHVLVDLQRGEAEGNLVLELGGEPLLDDVVAGLEKELYLVKCERVFFGNPKKSL